MYTSKAKKYRNKGINLKLQANLQVTLQLLASIMPIATFVMNYLKIISIGSR
jgi:hypothetical protein